MRTKLFQIRTKPLIFTDKWLNIHYKLLKNGFKYKTFQILG